MVLVTGGTGLVGSHLLLQLAKAGHQVRALYRTKEKIALVEKIFGYYETNAKPLLDRIEWLKSDILDIPNLTVAFTGIDTVYHCAAYISFDPKDRKKLLKTNIEGTANVVNQCIDSKIKKLCYVSSIAAIGGTPDDSYVTESTEWNNTAGYGYALSKHGAELEVWRASQEGVPSVIVNPGVILGPGFWTSGSGLFFKAAFKEPKYALPSGTGFVTVRDVVNAMVLLMEQRIENQRFILVSANRTYLEVMAAMAKAMHKKPPKKVLSQLALQVGWRLDWLKGTILGKRRKLSKATAALFSTQEYYDSSKILSVLKDFTFEDIDAEIKRTAVIFLAEQRS